MNQFIIQGIGFVGLLFVIFSFQKYTRTQILLFMLVGLLFFIIHYVLLHAWTGALLNVIEAGMVYVSFQKEKKPWARKKFWPYFFTLLFIVSGLLTLRTFVGVLPVLAQIFAAIAVWQDKPRALRYLMLVPRPLWFLYNFSVGSLAGMLTEVFIFLSVVVGIVRFDLVRQLRSR